jgi:hypothetical protein
MTISVVNVTNRWKNVYEHFLAKGILLSHTRMPTLSSDIRVQHQLAPAHRIPQKIHTIDSIAVDATRYPSQFEENGYE